MENKSLPSLSQEFDEPNIDMRWITPSKLFKRYFSDTFFLEIVKFTNAYARLNLNNSKTLKTFKDVTLEEIKVYVALLIMMGIHKHTCLKDHWSKDEFHSSKFKRYMSFKRFKLISSVLHLSDPEADGFNKIRLLQNKFNRVSKKLYKLTKHLTIDENLYPFKGKFRHRQYIKSKPHKYGLKAYLLSSSSGYCYRVKFYEGKKENVERIVNNLIRGFDMEGHILYADNWYSTIDLVRKLTDKKISYLGVLRKNRLKDSYLKSLKPNKNEFIITQNKFDNRILIFTVRQIRLFHLISNCHPNNEDDSILQSIIDEYNRYSKGVDITNRLCASYRYPHRTVKWWKKIFLYFLELITSNCYILYSHKENKMSHKDFNFNISLSLLNN
jgi:hypothetical protein